jgi:hypothetical protein
MSIRQGYAYKILLFIDLFLCAVLFRDPDITLSSEAGLAMQRAKPPLWARALNGFLNIFQKNHCTISIEADIERARIATEYLTTKQP